jgi:hypothetical protein
MQLVISALVILFALLMALWPLAWLVALLRHALARQWRRVGKVALLLPLWTIAASIGAIQVGRLLAGSEGAAATKAVVAATSLGVAACVAALAWLLLMRSFADRG